MTRPARLAGLACLLAFGLAGCGKYGPPVRAAATGAGVMPASSGNGAVHPDDCRDPAHGHAEADSGAAPEGEAP